MSNALEQAKRAADDAALTTTVRINLKLLQALIAEIERLTPLHQGMDKMIEDAKVRSIKP